MGLTEHRFEFSEFRRSRHVAILLVALAIFLLVCRLFSLQIIQGENFRHLSEENFVQHQRVAHDRGKILDRNGVMLAGNRPCVNLYVTPAFYQNTQVLKKLSEQIELKKTDLQKINKTVSKARGLAKFQPILIKEDITRDQLTWVETFKNDLDGITIQVKQRRYYPFGEALSHLVGFMNEINQHEYKRLKSLGYYKGDLIGRFGLEKIFEKHLRGQDGLEKIIVDARGKEVDDQAEKFLGADEHRLTPPVSGNNLRTTIDIELQKAIFQNFHGKAGAAVGVDVNTGDILALYSKPGFDPNLLSGRIDAKLKKQLDTDPLTPWINRTIQQHYPPGSIFKVVPALAALEAGRPDKNFQVNCGGSTRLGRRRWSCWKRAGHGRMDFISSMKQSCDVFFYKLGLELGLDSFCSMARKLGLGQKTGIILKNEVKGIIPSKDYYNRHLKYGFQKGFILNNVIGQGDVNVTPLQMALLYATLSNGGQLFRPRLVKQLEDNQGNILDKKKPEIRAHLKFNPKNINIILKGLKAVVNEKGGTAYWYRLEDFPLGGKTGTAQVVNLKRVRAGNFFHKDHAWFASIATIDKPKIALIILNEHGGHGSSGAASIAKKVWQTYLRQQ